MSRPANPKKSRPARAADGPGALALIEEAVHLLRGTPAGLLAIYYAGAVPWTVGFLYFWASASWFAPTGARLAWFALGLTGLYGWLKCAQAEFCARLLARRAGLPSPPLTARRLGHVALTQLRWQTWGLLALLPALVLTVPAGWVFAFCQNLSVLAAPDDATPKLGEVAIEEAALWPGQNHAGLALISGLVLTVWLNCATFFYLLPSLAHTLFGVENLFGLQGFAWFNTTFLASVSVLTWLVVDPLVKAFYVLRVFYGRSRRTGADLRGELAAVRAGRGTAALATGLLALLLLAAGGPTRLVAAATPPPATAQSAAGSVEPGELDRAIERALQQDDFQWRLRPLPVPANESAADEGWFRSFVREGAKWLGEFWRSVWGFVVKVIEWIVSLLPSGSDPARPSSAKSVGFSVGGLLTVFLYVLLALVVGLLLVVVFILWRKGRRPAPLLTARAVATATPDLRDENVQATQLPADGWLALAREMLASGEWRLALRALYLATLARLAAEGLLTLVRSKTNLDYERELTRRAPARDAVVDGFRRRRREFEDVWYGAQQPDATQVRAWLTEMEGGAAP